MGTKFKNFLHDFKINWKQNIFVIFIILGPIIYFNLDLNNSSSKSDLRFRGCIIDHFENNKCINKKEFPMYPWEENWFLNGENACFRGMIAIGIKEIKDFKKLYSPDLDMRYSIDCTHNVSQY